MKNFLNIIGGVIKGGLILLLVGYGIAILHSGDYHNFISYCIGAGLFIAFGLNTKN